VGFDKIINIAAEHAYTYNWIFVANNEKKIFLKTLPKHDLNDHNNNNNNNNIISSAVAAVLLYYDVAYVSNALCFPCPLRIV